MKNKKIFILIGLLVSNACLSSQKAVIAIFAPNLNGDTPLRFGANIAITM